MTVLTCSREYPSETNKETEMSKRNLFLKVVPLMVVAFMLAIPWASVTYAHTPEGSDTATQTFGTGNTGALAMPEPGWASIVWTNYNGGSDALNVDVLGVYYTVAPQSGSTPGQMQIFVQPGTYAYTASVADLGSVTRDIQVSAGQVIRLGFIASDPQQVNNNSSTLDDNQTFFSIGFDKLSVYEQDLTGQLAMLAQAAS
jgi:hypothetical protein